MSNKKTVVGDIESLKKALTKVEEEDHKFISQFGKGRVFLNDRRNIKKLVSFSAKEELIRMRIKELEDEVKKEGDIK